VIERYDICRECCVLFSCCCQLGLYIMYGLLVFYDVRVEGVGLELKGLVLAK